MIQSLSGQNLDEAERGCVNIRVFQISLFPRENKLEETNTFLAVVFLVSISPSPLQLSQFLPHLFLSLSHRRSSCYSLLLQDEGLGGGGGSWSKIRQDRNVNAFSNVFPIGIISTRVTSRGISCRGWPDPWPAV